MIVHAHALWMWRKRGHTRLQLIIVGLCSFISGRCHRPVVAGLGTHQVGKAAGVEPYQVGKAVAVEPYRVVVL